ncbi:helix-turn-helix transcriptional regulator [Thalassotalea fonticola]|uniref:Helix-turn-helix transcriptional regulator n=1 Tax=Thalassotalea fonticola TaxID=3065649 RepID=A0ABZ0GMA8_9GAMM|nr:helix-turn-helix transcriptional regulator [Colwelliaceae bacterium S1-1]
MSQINSPLEKWSNSLANLIENIGTQEFYPFLSDVLESISPFDDMVVIAYPESQKPFLVFHDLADKHKQTTLNLYFSGGYFLDPFYNLQSNVAEEGIYHLSDLAPDEFSESEYFKNYYAGTELKDELGFLLNYDQQCKVILSLGVRNKDNVVTEQDISRLKNTFKIVKALCHQHWQRVSLPFPNTEGQYEGEMGLQLSKAFKNFATDFLSERECEIVRLILKGYSSKSIAELLGISPDTVKVHRKHIHLKLEVSSQAELFSLFLSSLSLTEIGSDVDPLTLYFQ